MNAILGSTCLAFQVLSISGLNLQYNNKLGFAALLLLSNVASQNIVLTKHYIEHIQYTSNVRV